MSTDGMEPLWEAALVELGIKGALLHSRSFHDPGRRTYVMDGVVYKLSLSDHEISGWRRAQDLRGEFGILKTLSGISGAPEAVGWKKCGRAECLAMGLVRGEQLSAMSPGPVRFVMILARLGILTIRIAARGVSHDDIGPDNILVNNGKISLIDFDQARRAGFSKAILRSFFGIKSGGDVVNGSFVSLVKDYLKKNMSPGAVHFFRRIMGKDVRPGHRLPDLAPGASNELRSMRLAWNIAQKSDASSPGQRLAYYSYEFQGVRFPGERPWEERWAVLGAITDFSGKRVLELGCNMALLSASLLKEKRAKAAFGVDMDERILESARLVSSALGASPFFRQVDLDSTDNWEAALSEFKPDIVFALNVLNWVKDKDRLMRFLGRFDEVIFEGHDSVEIESERFKKAGFRNIRLIVTTERNRPVLHCRK